MKEAFREIQPEQIADNPFTLIGSDWMLITAGSPGAFNTMTASWGGMGVLWGRKVCFCFIRPQRHTFRFMEEAGHFTLSFFDKKHKGKLLFCGTHSGRDIDKVKETGLTPLEGSHRTVHFREARLVLECRKLYIQDIDPRFFLDPSIEDNYPEKDYHRMYVGEVLRCLARK